MLSISGGGQKLGPEPQDPRRKLPAFLSSPSGHLHCAQLLLCKLEGCWVGLLSLLKPFCFCIKGREAAFFFFWVIFTLPKSEKCPNQIGGQVATGNHSTKPVFFFFHFFLKPHVEGKLTECQLAALHTESPMLSKHGEQSRK